MIGINMEMPETCKDCPFQYRHYASFVYVCQLQNDAITDIETRPADCPLVDDAEEVVWCKDCKWAEKAILGEYCVECTIFHTSCMRHGYCHHGERKEP